MKRTVALLVAAMFLLWAPALASAAGTTPTPGAVQAPAPAVKGTPAKPELIDVQLWPEDVKGSMTMIVAVVIPGSATLPASVAVPLPKGATITWAGEIFETTTEDVPRQPIVSPDGTWVTLTSAKSRVVQYEAQYSKYSDRDGRRFAVLDWLQNQAADKVQFSYRLPAFASDVKSSPRYEDVLGPNANGEKMYSLPVRTLKVGERFKLAVDYVPQAVSLPAAAKRGPDILLISLGAFLAVAVAALAVVVARSRPSA